MNDRRINSRIGLRGGDHAMRVSFRDPRLAEEPRLITDVQRMYRTRTHTQRELAEAFDLSPGLVNKICRVDPRAPRNLRKATS